MLRTIDLRGETLTTSRLRRVLPRGGTDVSSVMDIVIPMVNKVREGGVAAALDFGEKFDGIRPAAVRVPHEELEKAAQELAPQVRAAIEESIASVRAVHADQKPAPHTTTLAPGATVTEVFQPIERVGLYVPGGKAVYPSSVIMNAVPAQEAGAEAMVVASPPQKEFGGLPHPTVLATCHMLGVDDVWAVGGGQAIALLAYGDDEPATGEDALEPVDIITGPGNVSVSYTHLTLPTTPCV